MLFTVVWWRNIRRGFCWRLPLNVFYCSGNSKFIFNLLVILYVAVKDCDFSDYSIFLLAFNLKEKNMKFCYNSKHKANFHKNQHMTAEVCVKRIKQFVFVQFSQIITNQTHCHRSLLCLFLVKL